MPSGWASSTPGSSTSGRLLGLAHLSVWKASCFDWKLLSVWSRGGDRGTGTNKHCWWGLKEMGEQLSAPQGLVRDWTVVQLGLLVIGALGPTPASR